MKQHAWNTFSAAPHRMFFFAGALQSVLVMAWWLADLGGRYGGWYAPFGWGVAPTEAHAFLMLYAFFPLPVFGFLMTTYPRWMNGQEVERRCYVPAFLLLAAGILLFYASLLWLAALLVPALALFLAGWAWALLGLLQVYWRARHPDKRHARITSAVLGLGWLLVLAWLAGVLAGQAFLLALAKSGGIWLFLFPIFFAISHRMIPFFSANVIADYRIVRPDWALSLMPSAALAHAGLELAGLPAWLWLVDLPMAAVALYLTWAWRLRASLGEPLLAMLHIGFAWLGVALLLYAFKSAALLAGLDVLGKAPLHALTVGYFSSMVIAMLTRVTLGHSGRRLAADRLTWRLFLLFQLAVLVRLAADVPGLDFMQRGHLYLGSAALWLACFGTWVFRYAPIYCKARADGNPG